MPITRRERPRRRRMSSALASWIEYGRGAEYKPALHKQWLNEARGRWPIIDRRKDKRA